MNSTPQGMGRKQKQNKLLPELPDGEWSILAELPDGARSVLFIFVPFFTLVPLLGPAGMCHSPSKANGFKDSLTNILETKCECSHVTGIGHFVPIW
jgi:hypothetical protein